MKIVTWNVNSIRTRLERAIAWIEQNEPDVLCLQEIKVVDDAFPRDAFESLGYHVETFGQKTYNGVAFISRAPAEDVVRGIPDDEEDAEARVIAGTFAGVRVVGVYVPNGKRVESEFFPYKIGWLNRLLASIRAAHEPSDPVVLLGDFNIAPDERDVHDPELWKGKVHFHPLEHATLRAFFDWGFGDLLRKHHDEAGLYTWWDYRAGGFQRNKGLRIDLVLGTTPMWDRCVGVEIDRDERKERKDSKPSDHVPVVALFD